MHYQWEIPQIYHTCALFDSPKIGNLMGLRVFCVGNGGFWLRWVGWGVFCDGRCSGFFATVLGGFFATVEGFLATARRVICISGGFLRR